MFSDVLHEVSLIIKTWWQHQKELGQVFWPWCMPANIFHPFWETFPVCSSKSDHLSFVPQLGQVHGSIIVINHKITIITMISIYLVYGHWGSNTNNWQAVYYGAGGGERRGKGGVVFFLTSSRFSFWICNKGIIWYPTQRFNNEM